MNRLQTIPVSTPVARAALYAVAILFLSLAGCAVGPDYKRPELKSPPDFRFASTQDQTDSLADLPWW